jgi:hypothetical protein
MVERGEYRAQNPSSQIPGFRISQLISLKRPWGSIATEFVAAKKSPETLKAFMNTVLAELWEENHEVPTDARALWNRCEPFEAEAPDGVALITAGVDVQADRLEVEIVGWGRDEESWSIAHHVIPGDVMRNEVWDHLEGLLLAEHLHDSGQTLRLYGSLKRLLIATRRLLDHAVLRSTWAPWAAPAARCPASWRRCHGRGRSISSSSSIRRWRTFCADTSTRSRTGTVSLA